MTLTTPVAIIMYIAECAGVVAVGDQTLLLPTPDI
jgi:hypothetical protein